MILVAIISHTCHIHNDNNDKKKKTNNIHNDNDTTTTTTTNNNNNDNDNDNDNIIDTRPGLAEQVQQGVAAPRVDLSRILYDII